MITNNIAKAIIQRSARRVCKYIRTPDMKYFKHYCHKSYRHSINIKMNQLAAGTLDYDDYNDHPESQHICTAWDIW